MLRDVLDGRVHLNYALRTFVRKTQRCHRSILIGVIDDHALKTVAHFASKFTERPALTLTLLARPNLADFQYNPWTS